MCPDQSYKYSVHDPLVSFNAAEVPEGAGYVADEGDDTDWYETAFDLENCPEPYRSFYNDLGEIFGAIDKDLHKDIYGDHVELTATVYGIEVEEYHRD